MGWPTGFEPVIAEPQSAVLPLHHGHHTCKLPIFNYPPSLKLRWAQLITKSVRSRFFYLGGIGLKLRGIYTVFNCLWQG